MRFDEVGTFLAACTHYDAESNVEACALVPRCEDSAVAEGWYFSAGVTLSGAEENRVRRDLDKIGEIEWCESETCTTALLWAYAE